MINHDKLFNPDPNKNLLNHVRKIQTGNYILFCLAYSLRKIKYKFRFMQDKQEHNFIFNSCKTNRNKILFSIVRKIKPIIKNCSESSEHDLILLCFKISKYYNNIIIGT